MINSGTMQKHGWLPPPPHPTLLGWARFSQTGQGANFRGCQVQAKSSDSDLGPFFSTFNFSIFTAVGNGARTGEGEYGGQKKAAGWLGCPPPGERFF